MSRRRSLLSALGLGSSLLRALVGRAPVNKTWTKRANNLARCKRLFPIKGY